MWTVKNRLPTLISVRIVEVLGREIPMKLFKETQKIERDGGMMIMVSCLRTTFFFSWQNASTLYIQNGQRRRTPGGVFLFLLKHSDEVEEDCKKLIFIEDTRKKNQDKKTLQSIKREREVEELKKSLKSENELTVLSTRSELLLNAEIQANRKSIESLLSSHGSVSFECFFVFNFLSIESTAVTSHRL